MAFQATFAFGDEASLSVAERIEAASRGIQHGSGLRVSVFEVSLTLAAALLLAWVVLHLGRRLRRRRWIGHHLQRLAEAGLHAEEIALFRQVALSARPETVPLLSRQRGVFDEGSATFLARQRPAIRRERLSELLALRRRVPFDARAKAPPALEAGTEVELWVGSRGGAPARVKAWVVATPPTGLQLALEPGALDGDIDDRLQVGQELRLVVARERRLEEMQVRIRGRASGQSLQLLVDRPLAASAARVRIAWVGADEPVRIELVERFSERVVGDSIPQVDGRIVASCGDGLLIRFDSVRPRHGEAIQLLDGSQPGWYRGFATLETSGRGGTVFMIRRSSERSDAPRTSAREKQVHEPVEA